MGTINYSQAARTSTLLTLGTLASGTYICSSAIDLGASIPLDATIEVVPVTNSAPSGNKQIMVFAKFSLDNSNFGSGPESGTTTTDEPDLHFVGVVPTVSASTTYRKFFSLSGLPIARYCKIVCKNDLGTALASGEVYRGDISGSTA
jgi:hypothetical protein